MKTKSFKILFAAIVLFFLQGCRGDNTPDELSGNYFVRHEGELMNHQPNKKEIFGRVIKYDYNSNFIIALQHPDYKDYVSMIAFNLRDDIKKYPQNSEKDIETTELLADSILKHNPL
ncbi:hypothetical protein [Mucilaginibacter sp.]